MAVERLDWIGRLREPPSIGSLGPIAARFVYSLRLIALHERAKRDPVPELAARLGSVTSAGKTLLLAHTISATWPENIHIAPFCCKLMSPDEATIGRMVDAVADRDRPAFESELAGFVRSERITRLWDAALGLVAAEIRA